MIITIMRPPDQHLARPIKRNQLEVYAMKTSSKVLMTLIAVAAMNTAMAADSGDIKVKASVVNNCKINAISDINFGALDPSVATNASASGSVNFSCTKNVDYVLSAGNGAHFDSALGKRRMKGADSNFLPYTLAQASFTGKGMGYASPITVALSASVQGTDYRDLPADNYLDTVQVTITP